MAVAASEVSAGNAGTYRLLGVTSARVIYVLVAAALSLAAGFRWFGEGLDFAVYWKFYNSIPTFFDVGNNRFEFGYQFTARVFRIVFNLEYEVFATFLTAVALGIKFYLFDRYLAKPFWAVVIYLGIFYPVHEYTQVRAALAVSLGMLAIHLWISGKRWWSALFAVLAFSFHYSIPALFAAFFASYFFRTRLRIAAACALLAIVLLRTDFVPIFAAYASGLNPVVENYAYGNDFYYQQNLFSVQNIVLAFVTLYSLATPVFTSSGYHTRMTVILLAALAVIPVFYGAPVVSARLRDILMVSAVFLVCRSRLDERELPMVLVMTALSLWQFRSAIEDGLIAF